MVHNLKTLPSYFNAVVAGKKTFEVRQKDRDFNEGDSLLLQEWNDDYTGRSTCVDVIYVLDDPVYCKEGYVILGIGASKTGAEQGK